MINDVIKLLRVANNVGSTKNAAEAIGLSYPYLYELETGKKIAPTLSVLSKIATYYNIPLDEIIRLSELEDNSSLDYQQLLYCILEYYVKQKSANLESASDSNKTTLKKI